MTGQASQTSSRGEHDDGGAGRDTSGPGGFVENLPFGVWICDAAGRLQYASASFLQLLGMSMAEASGFGWTKRLICENGDVVERWQTCVRSEQVWDDEYRIRDQSGESRLLLSRGQPVRDESGQITHWEGVHLDITKRARDKEHQRILALLEGSRQERERIARRLHDHLQQLLIGADLQLAALQKEELDPKSSSALAYVSEVVTQAIEASRNLAVELNPPVLYESGLAAALEWLAQFVRRTHGLQVEMKLAIEREPDERWVLVALFGVVRELLLNIVKHAGVNRATVTATQSDDRTRILVTDVGSGFDTQQCDQLDDSSGGFGLVGIRQQVEALGGTFSIDSAPGQGTTVAVIVPVMRE